jgi:uncharacterized protein YjbI with pentapeptide repeats
MTGTRRARQKRMAAPQVLAEYGEGRRDFMHVDIRGVDLSNHDLTGASFFEGNLRGVNLSSCTRPACCAATARGAATTLAPTMVMNTRRSITG